MGAVLGMRSTPQLRGQTRQSFKSLFGPAAQVAAAVQGHVGRFEVLARDEELVRCGRGSSSHCFIPPVQLSFGL